MISAAALSVLSAVATVSDAQRSIAVPVAAVAVDGLTRKQVSNHLTALRAKGLLHGAGPTTARTVSLTELGCGELSDAAQPPEDATTYEVLAEMAYEPAPPAPEAAAVAPTEPAPSEDLVPALEASLAAVAPTEPAPAPEAPASGSSLRSPSRRVGGGVFAAPRLPGGSIEVVEGGGVLVVDVYGNRYTATVEAAASWALAGRVELQTAAASRTGKSALAWRAVPKAAMVVVVACLVNAHRPE